MDNSPLTGLSLFSGSGCLELGIKLACPRSRVLGYVEKDSFAATIILERMEDACLEPAPIWCGEIEEFDSSLFAGVDFISAGFPCQTVSIAGKQKGSKDSRWLWPEIAKIICKVRPKIIFLENVPPLLRPETIEEIFGDLADLRFNAEWGVFSAADVGAPHARKRVFILAYSQDIKWRGREEEFTISQEKRRTGSQLGSFDMANASSQRHETPGISGNPNPFSDYWPPGPDDYESWSRLLNEDPSFAPGIKLPLRGKINGVAEGLERSLFTSRPDKLHLLGNSVTPLAVALAWSVLWQRVCK